MTLSEKFLAFSKLVRNGDYDGARVFYETHKRDSKFAALCRLQFAMVEGLVEGMLKVKKKGPRGS